MMAADIELSDAPPRLGKPRLLFERPFYLGGGGVSGYEYDVMVEASSPVGQLNTLPGQS